MNTAYSRMCLYQELAFLFGAPGELAHNRLTTGAFVGELTALGGMHPCASIFDEEISDLHAIAASREEDIPVLYTTHFEVPNPPVSLFESGHFLRDIFELYEDLFRAYEYFGLNFENGAIKVRPDNLIVELDFMQYLVYLETLQPENAIPIRKAQKDFMERHLHGFANSLKRKLQEKNVACYHELSIFLCAFLAAEKRYLVQDVADKNRISLQQVFSGNQ